MTMWEFLDKNVDTLADLLGGVGMIIVAGMIMYFLYKTK